MAPGPQGDSFEHSGLSTYAAELISASLYLSGAGGKSATLNGLGLNLDTGNAARASFISRTRRIRRRSRP